MLLDRWELKHLLHPSWVLPSVLVVILLLGCSHRSGDSLPGSASQASNGLGMLSQVMPERLVYVHQVVDSVGQVIGQDSTSIEFIQKVPESDFETESAEDDATRIGVLRSPIWLVESFLSELPQYWFETSEGLFYSVTRSAWRSGKLLSNEVRVGERWSHATTLYEIVAVDSLRFGNRPYRSIEVHGEWHMGGGRTTYVWALGLGLVEYSVVLLDSHGRLPPSGARREMWILKEVVRRSDLPPTTEPDRS